jgi:hypothetical protein
MKSYALSQKGLGRRKLLHAHLRDRFCGIPGAHSPQDLSWKWDGNGIWKGRRKKCASRQDMNLERMVAPTRKRGDDKEKIAMRARSDNKEGMKEGFQTRKVGSNVFGWVTRRDE